MTTTNDGDVEATVHWHGLRLENRYDGVPQETQAPISIGDLYTANVHFPDPGLYWYHPHILFDKAGDVLLEHRAPDKTQTLGVFNVAGSAPALAASTFSLLRSDPELSEVRKTIDSDVERPPDKVLGFSSSMPLLYDGADSHASSYVCPMHPEVTSTEPGTCPKCGMKLIPTVEPVTSSYVCPMHPEVTSTEPGTCPKCGMKLIASDSPLVDAPHAHDHGGDEGDGLEWEDLMPDINRQTEPVAS